MATIEKRTNKKNEITYRAKVRMKGYKSESATFPRKTDALKWIQDTESAMRDGRYFKTAEAKKHTLDGLITHYLNWRIKENPTRYKDVKPKLEWWSSKLGYLTLADISKSKILDALDDLGNDPMNNGEVRKTSTLNRYAADLSHVFTKAINDWDMMEDSPMRKFTKYKEPKGRTRFLDDEEKQRLLQECRKSTSVHLFPIVLLALSTGMRKGEILKLQWQDIDFDRSLIIIHEAKNGEKRTVPLTGQAYDILKKHCSIRYLHTNLVFPSLKGDLPIDTRASWLSALIKTNGE